MNSRNINKKNICVGVITSAQGIKGNVKIKSFTSPPKNITNYGKIFNQDCSCEFKIKILSANNDILIASIDGINDRNAAEKLAKVELFIDRDNLPETESEDEFYISDLIGMDVINQDGAIVGLVMQMHNFGSGDIVEIKFNDKKESEMISFTKDNFPKIDLHNNMITIELQKRD